MVPAALVIGGGITGMQAALDIANAGFKVILVEKSPTVGGRMLQLSEVFPTLDCPQCIGTPKMVEVGSHPNIELMSYSEVESINGSVGNFTVRVKKKPRYVILDKCTGCGDCANVCPVSMPSEWDIGLSTRKAAYIPFPQAVPAKFTIDKKGERPCKAACKAACPISTNIQGYLALIANDKAEEAYELIRRTNPLPSVCGRVCYHPCEGVCNRQQVDDPLAIVALKRFATDQVDVGKLEVPQITRNGRKVAIVGSGPAGLAAANDLALLGYDVTIFEALPDPGGMLRVGIPEYRLPKDLLKQEIGYIERLLVEIKTNTRVGDKVSLEELRNSYEAIFIATGAHDNLKLDIPGENVSGVINVLDFLYDVNMGKEAKVGKKVAIIGGGNTAIDAARVVRRLGASSVTIVYRRSRQEMPATAAEVEAAEAEGIEILFLATPTKIMAENGKVLKMECIRIELGEPDASGRRRPIPVKGSEFTIDVDSVIPALGQSSNLEFVKDMELGISQRGTLTADANTLATNIEGVFAGGDVVSGPDMVITAIAAGKKAALSIDKYLKGESLIAIEETKIPEKLSKGEVVAIKERFSTRSRVKMAELEPKKRIKNFSEVEQGYTIEEARREAGRCLASQIEGCFECFECVGACDAKAINHDAKVEYEERDVGAIIIATGYDTFDARLKPELAYGVYPNVITGIELERLSQAGGPTEGQIEINGREPKNVVFIQCVGSRDKSVNVEYCSRVCCMYTAKQAWYIKEKIPEAKVTVFYIDIRAYGKGYEEFYERVQKKGVIYRRGAVSEVYRRGNKLVVKAEDTLVGEVFEEEADLVVLATGLRPRVEVEELAKMLNVSTGTDGFFQEVHSELGAVESDIEGIYLAGCCQGPKDIPDSVAQASAAAALACITLSRVGKELVGS
ncbi:NAD(P)-binding protein [Chloroflexota bacterium]